MSLRLTVLLCVCLLGCVSPNRPVNTDRKDRTARITGERQLISDLDVQEIINAVQIIPRIDHNVLSIRVISANQVEVTTGIIQGPLAGGGDIVIIRREKDGWKWLDDGVRRFWNA